MAKSKGGRPTDYSLELSDLICSRLSDGESMRSICRDEDMPAKTTLFRWLREKPEFRNQYDVAKEESAESHADHMVDIADHEVSQPVMVDGLPLMVDGKPVMKVDATAVAHAKLRIDTRKWAASKLKPKKYGDRITTEHTGNIDINNLSDEDLTQRLRQAEQLLALSTKD